MPSSTSPAGESPRTPGPAADPGNGPPRPARPVAGGRRPSVVVLVVLIVTVVLGLGMTRLEFTTSQDNYLDSSSQIAKDNVEYQTLFGGEAMVSLFTVEPGSQLRDLFTPGNIRQFQELQSTLDEDPRIAAVVTPLAALEFTNKLVLGNDGNPVTSPAAGILLGAQARDPDPASAQRRQADTFATLERVNSVPPEQRLVTNPAWVDVLLHDNTGAVRKSLEPFFPTTSTAQMVTRLRGNASLKEEGQAARVVEQAVSGRTFDHAQLMTTGSPVLLRDINNYLRGGFLTLGGISLLLMAGLLVAAFAVRWRLLSLGAVGVGLVWAFGLAGYIGMSLSVVTIAGLPVLLGVGIDFAVQLHSRIEEEAQLDRARKPVVAALVGLRWALAAATLAAVLSFLTLRFSQVPMIQDFGTLLALGLPVIVVATVVLLATSLGAREQHRPTPPRDYTHGPLGRAVIRLGGLPRVTALPLVVIAIAIFVGGVAVDSRLTIQTDPEKWVNQDSQVIKDINTLRDRAQSASELGVYIQSSDVFSDETAAFAAGLANTQLSRHPGTLVDATSMVTIVSYLMEIPNTSTVLPTGQDLRSAYAVAPPDIQRSTVNLDRNALNMIFRAGSGSLERRAEVVRDIRNNTHPPAGVRATPSGLAVVGAGLVDSFKHNRAELTYYALAAVFVLLLLVHRSPVRAALSLVPVLIAVGLSSLIALVVGVDLSPLTVVSGPLIIALCTEFTTLLIFRHLEERDRGRTPLQAIEVSAARTGRAFVVSALAAVIGVGVLAFSSLPLLRDFGLLVALNVAVALLSALIVLPPLLLWADEHGWVHRSRTTKHDINTDDNGRLRTDSRADDRATSSAGGPAAAPAAGLGEAATPGS